MIDKLYTVWQDSCSAYDAGLNLRQTLPPYSTTVGDALNVLSNRYCYRYSNSGGDNPPVRAQNCPSDPTRTSTTSTVSGTATSTASPTPSANPVWLELWLQDMVTGHDKERIPISELTVKNKIQKRELEIEEILYKKIQDPKNENLEQPDGYGKATRTTAYFATTSALSEPTAIQTFVPFPEYKWNETYTIHAPPPEDKTDLINTRYASPIDDDFIARMRLDKSIVMNLVNFDKSTVDYFNNLKGFVSPAALKYTGLGAKRKCRSGRL
jgi:hypothetical protein